MGIRGKFAGIAGLLALTVLAFLGAGAYTYQSTAKIVGDTQIQVHSYLDVLQDLRYIDHAQLLTSRLESYGKERLENRNAPSPPSQTLTLYASLTDSLHEQLSHFSSQDSSSVEFMIHRKLQKNSDSLRYHTGPHLDSILASYRRHNESYNQEKTRQREVLTLALLDIRQALRLREGHIPYSLYRSVQLTLLELELHVQTLLQNDATSFVDASLTSQIEKNLSSLEYYSGQAQLAPLSSQLKHLPTLVRQHLLPYMNQYSFRLREQQRQLLKADYSINRFSDSLNAGFEQLIQLRHKELDHSGSSMDEVLDRLHYNLANTYFWGFVLATSSLTVIVLLLFGMARSIIYPLLAASRMASRIANGDFSIRNRSSRQDELGDLARTMDLMADHIAQATLTLEKRNNELEQKNRELEKYSYTVAHDLRTPLVTISGFLHEMLLDINANDQNAIQNDMATIQNAVMHMSSLLEGLLQISRLGKSHDELIFVPLLPLFHNTKDIMQGEFKACQAILDLPSTMPIVQGDPIRLQQIVQNLLENALKYRDAERPPRITVRCEGDGANYFIHIADNGQGFQPEFANRIFNLFEKLTKNTPGVGLGLAMCQRIAELHGGRIWAESEGIGKGSCFTLALPIPKDARNPQPSPMPLVASTEHSL